MSVLSSSIGSRRLLINLILPSSQDVFNTLVAGTGCIGQGLLTGRFKSSAGVFIRQLQKPHTTAVGLLLDPLGGKDCVDSLVRIGSNSFRPFTETVAIPDISGGQPAYVP